MVRTHHTYNLRLCGYCIPFPCCRTLVASALRLLHCRRAVRVAHQKIEEGQQFQANFLVQTPRISLPAHWRFLWPSEHAGGLSRQWELRRQPLLICCVIRREMNANTVWCWCTRHRKTANKHQTSRTHGKGLVRWCGCHNTLCYTHKNMTEPKSDGRLPIKSIQNVSHMNESCLTHE